MPTQRKIDTLQKNMTDSRDSRTHQLLCPTHNENLLDMQRNRKMWSTVKRGKKRENNRNRFRDHPDDRISKQRL